MLSTRIGGVVGYVQTPEARRGEASSEPVLSVDPLTAMHAAHTASAAERRAATCPMRVGGRNRLKRDAPSAIELMQSLQSESLSVSKTGPRGLNAMQAHMMTQPRNIDDFDETSSVSSIEAASVGVDTSGTWSRGSWPRVRKQRTPTGAMNIWEVNEALAVPAGSGISEPHTPAEEKDNASFVSAIFGADSDALEKPKLNHQDSLGNLGADLSHMHLPEGSSQHGDVAIFNSRVSFRDIVCEAPSLDLRAEEIMHLSQLEELREFEARGGRIGESGLQAQSNFLSIRDSDITECSWGMAINSDESSSRLPWPPIQFSLSHLNGLSNMAPVAPTHYFLPSMPVATAMLMPTQSPSPPSFTAQISGSMPMTSDFSRSSAQPPLPLSSKRNGPERKEWSATEDLIIREGVAEFGCRWRRIAAQLPGRSDDAVRNRWNRLKDLSIEEGALPKLGQHPRKTMNAAEPAPSFFKGNENGASAGKASGTKDRPERVSWTRAEDAIIVRSVAELGHKWYQIAAQLPGRTDHAVRNRFHRLQAMADDMQLMNERNGAVVMQQHPMPIPPDAQLQLMQTMQPIQSMQEGPRESAPPLVQQRHRLQEQQRELNWRQFVLEQQERELLQQHRQ